MNRFFNFSLPTFKDPVKKLLWVIFGLGLLALLLMTAGYFSGKALYYLTH